MRQCEGQATTDVLWLNYRMMLHLPSLPSLHYGPTSSSVWSTTETTFLQIRSMFTSKFTFLALALCCVAEAFVPQQSIATTVVKQTKLNALDPVHILDSVSTLLSSADVIPGTSGEVSYSRASYYTILGLYLMSFPGIWSTVKRSTKAKVKKKTYVT